jgi:SNF2 family DNA or RNA helicase
MLKIIVSPNKTLHLEGEQSNDNINLFNAFAKGFGHGLLFLNTDNYLNEHLAEEESLVYWREFSRLYLSLFVTIPNLDTIDILKIKIELPTDELNRFITTAPLMKGAEYIDKECLSYIWQQIEEILKTEIQESGSSISKFFTARYPGWNLLGKICFHLAENKNSPATPFAFLVTYAHQIDNEGRTKHLPLGRALKEYSESNQNNMLLKLLEPIYNASLTSELIKKLLDSGDIYHPLAWTAEDAYLFLKDTALFEQAGIAIKIPNWWKAKHANKPTIKIHIGEEVPSKLGFDGLLDFKAYLSLNDEPLTEEEMRDLMLRSENLVFFKGQWVEVDKEKLEHLLAEWKNVSKQAQEGGITFADSMRLMSGISHGSDQDQYIHVQERVVSGKWLKDILEEMRSPQVSNDIEKILDNQLQAKLRPYQLQGVSWLNLLNQLKLGAILADDMGLGKTLQVISLLLLKKQRKNFSNNYIHSNQIYESNHANGNQNNNYDDYHQYDNHEDKQNEDHNSNNDNDGSDGNNDINNTPSLLVLPASLIENWKNEINRFAPTIKYWVAHSSVDGINEPLSQSLDLIITTYGYVNRIKWLAEKQWDMIILDEAQAIKNPLAKQTKAIKALKASHKIVLTGTPVENSLADLWSLFDFVSPGLLGSNADLSKFMKQRGKENNSAYAALRTLVSPYILRRMKTDKRIISDLPDKTELKTYCSLTRAQMLLYAQAVESLTKDIREIEGIERRGIIFAYLIRFKQICNHPSHWLKDGLFGTQESGKFIRLKEKREIIMEKQEKLLVFTQFQEITGALADFLQSIFGRPGLVLHGGTPIKKRAEIVKSFQEEDGPPFFILSLKAGGVGLNLTAASHVIHFDRWWNPAIENQATDRAFRIGQKRNVLVHKFICKGTLEDRIDQLIDSKQSIANEILAADSSVTMLSELSNDDLLKIVSLDINSAIEEIQE